MQIDTYEKKLLPESQGGAYASDSAAGRAGTILGAGLSRVSSNISSMADRQGREEERLKAIQLHQQNVINDLTERKIGQIESLEENKKYSQLRTDWNNRMMELSKQPSDNVLEQVNKEYDDYTSKLIEGASSQRVKDRLSLLSSEYKIGLTTEAFKLQSKQQLSKFGAAFDEMMINAESSVFNTRSLTELSVQQELMMKTVEDARSTGQIQDPQIIQNLKEKINLLPVAWAESMLSTNPELVKSVALGEGDYKGIMDGVPSRTRALLSSKAEESVRVKDNQEKLLLKEALESDKVQRIQTGEGESLDLNVYEQAYGKPARDAAERELNTATQLHGIVEMSKGASQEQLNNLLVMHKPVADPKSPLYAEQQDLYMATQKIVAQAKDDKKEDAFTYFSQHPSVQSQAQQLAEANTPESRKMLQDLILSLQKSDVTMRPYEYRVMPQGDAEKFISNFNKLVEVGNKSDGAGVRDMLEQFGEEYGENTSIALQQLQQTKGGEQVTPKLNPLLWHVNNPTTFRLVVDAIRKEPSEQYKKFGTEKVIKNFLVDSSLDSNLVSYQASVVSANNSAEASKLAGGVHEVWTAFSRDYVLNGGKMKDASSIFFGNYSFGQVNNVTFARPLVYKDDTGKQHKMSEEQQTASDNFLTFFPKRLDADQIQSESILNEVGAFKPEEIKKDIENSLNNNTFWSTTEDESGVYLYTKGSILGTSRQVFYKDGTPVKVKFSDTLVPIPEQSRGKSFERYPSKTTDSIWDRLSSALLSSG